MKEPVVANRPACIRSPHVDAVAVTHGMEVVVDIIAGDRIATVIGRGGGGRVAAGEDGDAGQVCAGGADVAVGDDVVVVACCDCSVCEPNGAAR